MHKLYILEEDIDLWRQVAAFVLWGLRISEKCSNFVRYLCK